AENAWMSPPAAMLFPLMVSSIESSRYFYAVAVDPNVSKTDYRLESEVIRLQQNFLVKPSQLELVMQVMLIQTNTNKVLATNTIYERIPCPSDTPLGGVIAANQAASKLTRRITYFVIDHIRSFSKLATANAISSDLKLSIANYLSIYPEREPMWGLGVKRLEHIGSNISA
ncbi:MAG TPA: hypothetical protein VHD33_00140, partial [Legionellaceae bacterium]|nr:hypothetical protein [Legionellaceae bacterium]